VSSNPWSSSKRGRSVERAERFPLSRFLEEFKSVGEALHGALTLRIHHPSLSALTQADLSIFPFRRAETFLSSTSFLAGSPEADSSTAALNRQKTVIEASPFAPAAARALDQLYREEFGRFVRTKIVEQAKVRLGMFASQEERGDLGDGEFIYPPCFEPQKESKWQVAGYLCDASVTLFLTGLARPVYCLTNPRLPDHPIVMCSTGFVRLTE
jgi:hypothetical protein